MLICKYCGTSNPDDNNFCDHCGQRLEITKVEADDSVVYENNPFKTSEPAPSQKQEPTPKKNPSNSRRTSPSSKSTNSVSESEGAIKKCSRCHGTGKIKEEVPSLFGKSYEYKTCPKCHGIGKYIVDENGKHKDIISDSPSKSSNSATRTQYANQNKTTQQKNYKPAIALVCGLLGYAILFSLLSLPNNKKSSKSETTAIESTTIESTSEATLDPNIEFKSLTFKNLSFEIPSNWIATDANNENIAFAYKDDNDARCALIGGYTYYNDGASFETRKSEVINNLEEQANSQSIDNIAYEDYSVSDNNAMWFTYTDDTELYLGCIIDGSDGFYFLGSSIVSDSEDEFLPIIAYIINSCSFIASETEYKTYTSDYFSCEIPSDWEEFSSDGTSFYAYFISGSDITSDGYFINQISWFEEDHSNVEYEYLTIANNYAFKITGTSTYDGRIDEEYYIDYNGWDSYNGGYYLVRISYSSNEADTIRAEIDNFINTCSIEGPLEEIEFASTSFNSVTLDIPVDWVCIESSDDSESYSYTDANGMTYSYSIEYITDYSSVMEGDFKTWFYSRAEDPGCKDSYFTNIDSHNAAKLTIESEDQITTEYFIGNNDGMIHFSFAYPAEVSEQYKTIILYIVNSCSIDGEENVPEDSPVVTKDNTETTSNSSNKYAYYGNDTYYIIDLDEGKVYNFFTFDTDPYVGTCSGSLSSGLTVTYNLDGYYVTESIKWSGSGDSEICVIDSYGFDWYYSKTSYSSAVDVMD